MAKIIEIEGIGPAYAEKLTAAGVTTTDNLLTLGATGAGRKDLAAQTGIDEAVLLEWVNHCDLDRIKGVAWEFADLLEEAGVDSVPELAQRNAENLYQKLVEVNEAKNLVRRLPSQEQVAAFIAEAKTLPRLVHH